MRARRHRWILVVTRTLFAVVRDRRLCAPRFAAGFCLMQTQMGKQADGAESIASLRTAQRVCIGRQRRARVVAGARQSQKRLYYADISLAALSGAGPSAVLGVIYRHQLTAYVQAVTSWVDEAV